MSFFSFVYCTIICNKQQKEMINLQRDLYKPAFEMQLECSIVTTTFLCVNVCMHYFYCLF